MVAPKCQPEKYVCTGKENQRLNRDKRQKLIKESDVMLNLENLEFTDVRTSKRKLISLGIELF